MTTRDTFGRDLSLWLREEGEHLISLTNKVLTLAKLEHRQLRLDKTECLLRPMLEDLAAKYQAKAEKPIRYVWKLDAPAAAARSRASSAPFSIRSAPPSPRWTSSRTSTAV